MVCQERKNNTNKHARKVFHQPHLLGYLNLSKFTLCNLAVDISPNIFVLGGP